jgi:hypothetical protein
MGGWVDLRAGLNAVVKRKIPSPCRDFIQPLAQRQTAELSRLLAFIVLEVNSEMEQSKGSSM